MHSIVIDVGALHNEVHNRLGSTNIMSGINPIFRPEIITLEIFKFAVSSIFVSCEEDKVDIYAYIGAMFDSVELYEHCVSSGLLAEEFITVLNKESVSLDDYQKQVPNIPPRHEMVYLVFNEVFEGIVRYVHAMLLPSLESLPNWRWRVVEFDAVLDKRNRILALMLVVGDDIRHLVYKHIFKNKRFDSKVLSKLVTDEFDNGFRYDRRGRVVSSKSEDKGGDS